ncbi:MAG: polysaccharide pyruvyl transferase family protein [Mycobacteriales bacterium]
MTARGAPRIGLWGSAGLPNLGDRLISEVVRRELGNRLPGARTEVFSPWQGLGDRGDAVRRLLLDAGSGWTPAAGYDALVVPGGGLLAGPPFLHPVMTAFALGAEPAAFAPGTFVAWHAVGSQDDSPEPARPRDRRYLRSLADRLDHCTVRDAVTARRLGATGSPGPAVVPDPVFALEPFGSGARPARRRPLVGVSVGSSPHTASLLEATIGGPVADLPPVGRELCLTPEEVLARVGGEQQLRRRRTMAELARGLLLLAERADLLLVGIRNMYGDAPVAEQLAAALPGARCLLVDHRDHDAVTAAYGSCDTVLAARYHSMVLALRAGVPVVGVEVSAVSGPSKLRDLAARLGAPDRYWGHLDGPPPPLPDLVLGALRSGSPDEEADRYATARRAALAALDELAGRIADGVDRRRAG